MSRVEHVGNISEVQPAPMFPARRGLAVVLSVLAGFALTVVWSAEFVDQVIGENVTSTLIGHEAKGTPIAGMLAGPQLVLVGTRPQD